MECGEADLKCFLSDMKKRNRTLDSNMIRFAWQQMLTAVHVIHKHNIIHSDLKPANFLFVKGTLKLIDFGIARAMSAEATSILRESQVGTINYISPEALLDVGDGVGHKGARVGLFVWRLRIDSTIHRCVVIRMHSLSNRVPTVTLGKSPSFSEAHGHYPGVV